MEITVNFELLIKFVKIKIINIIDNSKISKDDNHKFNNY